MSADVHTYQLSVCIPPTHANANAHYTYQTLRKKLGQGLITYTGIKADARALTRPMREPAGGKGVTIWPCLHFRNTCLSILH
jgi:hypothetical protein